MMISQTETTLEAQSASMPHLEDSGQHEDIDKVLNEAVILGTDEPDECRELKNLNWNKKKKSEADEGKSGVAEVDQLDSSSPSIRYEESRDDPLAPTMLNPSPDEQQVETEESSIADSRSSKFLIAVSTLTPTDPVSSSSAITGAVLSSLTESQPSIQDGSRLASTRREFTASQPTVDASALTQGIVINANEQWDQRTSDIGASSKMRSRGCTAEEGIQELLLVSADPMQMTQLQIQR